MKRDLDLIRNIMLAIENTSDQIAFKGVAELANAIYETDYLLVSYHVSLLIDCNYLIALDCSTIGIRYADYFVERLTADGCDYLDSIRDTSIWVKTKEKLSAVGGSAALEIVKAVAVNVMRSQLGI